MLKTRPFALNKQERVTGKIAVLKCMLRSLSTKTCIKVFEDLDVDATEELAHCPSHSDWE